MHTRAHSASAETAESCGTTLSVVGTVLLPCAQTTLTAHGNPTATHHAHRKSPSFQQKPVPTPQRPQSPMCSIDNNHAHQAPPRRRPTNPPQTRAGTRPISTRTTTDLAAKMYRSRRGTGPISVRSSTDLDGAKCPHSHCRSERSGFGLALCSEVGSSGRSGTWRCRIVA